MEMFLFAVYAVSAVITGAVVYVVSVDKIKPAIEQGLQEASVEQGYNSMDEVPSYTITVARIAAWMAILILPVIPVFNTVLTLRLARKVYRRMTAE